MKENLAKWFATFFNLVRDKGQGTKVVNLLIDLNLLETQQCIKEWKGVFNPKPEFYYSIQCSPTFIFDTK